MDGQNRGAKGFAALFLVFVLLFSVGNLVFMKDGIVQGVKQIDWSWERAGQNLREVEQVINENLLLRYPMVDAYGAVQLAMGKREENGFNKVLDKKGFLYTGNFWNGYGPDTRELALRTKRFQVQAEAEGSRFGYIMMPMNLPEEEARYYGIPYGDNSKLADTFCGWARYYGVPLLNLQHKWKEHGLTQEETFFRTDHHWTPLAAFYGYGDILNWMNEDLDAGIEHVEQLTDLDNYVQTTYPDAMFGSIGREAGTVFTGGPEDYTVIYPKEKGYYTLENGQLDNATSRSGSFSDALLDTDYSLDHYIDYFHGEAEDTYLHNSVDTYVSIVNHNAPSEETVLILRDSYTTPVGAFLSQSFRQVDMLWSGQVTPEELEQFMAGKHYDYILISLCAQNMDPAFFPFGLEPDM